MPGRGRGRRADGGRMGDGGRRRRASCCFCRIHTLASEEGERSNKGSSLLRRRKRSGLVTWLPIFLPSCAKLLSGDRLRVSASLSCIHRHLTNWFLCLHLLTGYFPNKVPCPHLPAGGATFSARMECPTFIGIGNGCFALLSGSSLRPLARLGIAPLLNLDHVARAC